MRFLGIGDTCDLGAMYLRLKADGHEVKVAIAEPLAQGTLEGMVEHVANWRDELDWARAAGDDGIVLFENVAKSRGALQDELRARGLNVIGGSAYGDRLENDRAYAQRALADIGLPILRVAEFRAVGEAERYLAAHDGCHVLKFNGPGFSAADTYVGRIEGGRDLVAILRSARPCMLRRDLARRARPLATAPGSSSAVLWTRRGRSCTKFPAPSPSSTPGSRRSGGVKPRAQPAAGGWPSSRANRVGARWPGGRACDQWAGPP